LFTLLAQGFTHFGENLLTGQMYFWTRLQKGQPNKMAAASLCGGGGEAGHLSEQEQQGGWPVRPGTISC